MVKHLVFLFIVLASACNGQTQDKVDPAIPAQISREAYSEKKIGERLKPGLLRGEVELIFGKPDIMNSNENGEFWEYLIPPELLGNEGELVFAGFTIVFDRGVLKRWLPITARKSRK